MSVHGLNRIALRLPVVVDIDTQELVACFSCIFVNERLELPFRPLIKVAFFEYRVARQVSTGNGLEMTSLGRRLAPKWFIGEECGFDEVGANLRLTLSRLGTTNRRNQVFHARNSGASAVEKAPKRVTPKMAAKQARKMARSAGVSLLRAAG